MASTGRLRHIWRSRLRSMGWMLRHAGHRVTHSRATSCRTRGGSDREFWHVTNRLLRRRTGSISTFSTKGHLPLSWSPTRYRQIVETAIHLSRTSRYRCCSQFSHPARSSFQPNVRRAATRPRVSAHHPQAVHRVLTLRSFRRCCRRLGRQS